MGKQKQTVEFGEKVRVELRVDAEVYKPISDLADKLGVSVNQLVQGVLRWAGANAHPNEMPDYSEEARGQVPHGEPVPLVKSPGVVWFGSPDDVAETEDGQEFFVDREVAFTLDFTERRVVVDAPSVNRQVVQKRKGKRRA